MGNLLAKNDIGASVAARIMHCSSRRIRQLCLENFFKTAHKPMGPRGNWHISRLEVLQKKHIDSLAPKFNPD